MPDDATARRVLGPVVRVALLAWLVAAVALRPQDAGPAFTVLLVIAVAGLVPWSLAPFVDPSGRRPRYRTAVAVGVVVAAVGGALASAADPTAGLTLAAVGASATTGRATSTPRHVVAVVTTTSLAAVVVLVASGDATWGRLAVALGSVALGTTVGALRRQARQTAAVRDAAAANLLAAARSEAENAALRERQRIAREIHDVLAHSLGGLAVQLDAAEALAEAGRPDEVLAVVRRSRALAVEGLREARDAVAALRTEGDLGDRLAALAATENAAGADVRLALPDPLPYATESATHALERVAREALTNARKHARGAAVTVSLAPAGDHLELVVADDGGTRSPVASTGAGRGVAGMRERVTALGGTLAAGPAGTGWEVRATVPADPTSPARTAPGGTRE